MAITQNSLHYSFGKSKRKGLAESSSAKIVPGPGQYQYNFSPSKTAPKWGFGSGSRPELNVKSSTGNLGPG